MRLCPRLCPYEGRRRRHQKAGASLDFASCASITTRGSLPRNQKTAGVSHLPSFDDQAEAQSGARGTFERDMGTTTETPLDRVAERQRAVALARHYREAEGLSGSPVDLGVKWSDASAGSPVDARMLQW